MKQMIGNYDQENVVYKFRFLLDMHMHCVKYKCACAKRKSLGHSSQILVFKMKRAKIQ